MNFNNYLADRKTDIAIATVLVLLTTWLLAVFNVNPALIVLEAGIIVVSEIVRLIYGYKKKASFYNTLTENVSRLDKAYLVLETLEKPDFLEGKLLYDVLYDINKSMNENVNELLLRNKDFREYIELWIHEVKLPLSSIDLKLHNLIESASRSDDPAERENAEVYRKLRTEVKRIDSFVEQVLYYSRSDNSEKDYHIMKVPLSKIIHETAMEHREALLDNGIELRIENDPDVILNTDRKWFSFILGQLISNSIKYKRDIPDAYIKLRSESDGNLVKVYVEDNGIGIPAGDIDRIFDKSFTGKNGIGRPKSTGMGLYIVSTLCEKLGHTISAESEEGRFTRICITADDYEYLDVVG